ncbi:MAG: hypothetical protein HPAVJP_1380 [Candidatus Hepatoplasma vulgare]|nr:MAG: hypothetical protein HPAVJP_1380 [Candidatus Hepatoplasma sp.]
MKNNLLNLKDKSKLILNLDEENILETNKYFVSKIEEFWTDFNKNYQDLEKKYSKYLNNKNFFYQKEFLIKKSPIILLTTFFEKEKLYFVESLIENLIDKKVNLKKFKNVISLDVWKYLNLEEMTNDLFSILASKYKQQKEKILKISKSLANTTLISWSNKWAKTSIKEIKTDKKMDELIEDIEIEPTLIIIDNVDKMDNNGWDLIIKIFQFSKLKNLCFVLIIDSNKLDDINKGKFYSLKKYINYPIFELI